MKHVIEWVRANGPYNNNNNNNNNTKSRDYYNTNSYLDILFLGRRTDRQDNIENVSENEDNPKAIYNREEGGSRGHPRDP